MSFEYRTKVAWYDIGKGWGRDWWMILHPPYSAWFLSYVVIGAALAPGMRWSLLGWTILSFMLGMVIAAHALDELHGRPLKTRVPAAVLWGVAGISLAGAAAIGALVGVRETHWVIPLIIFGMFIALAYNLEWGFFHHDVSFAFAWGAFPVLTAYIAQTHTVTWTALLVATFAFFYSLAQRKLSMQARFFRRKVERLDGAYTLVGASYRVTKETIIGPVDLALKFMTWGIILLAMASLVGKIYGT